MALFAFDCIRYVILENLSKIDGKIGDQFELDMTYFNWKRKGNCGSVVKNKTIVFGTLERKDIVWVEIVKNVWTKTLLKNTVKKVKIQHHVYVQMNCIRYSCVFWIPVSDSGLQ